MLQALLHRKLERWLGKDPATIEDLLTSVVLGTASYFPKLALLPFLGAAESAAESAAGTRLEARLTGLVVRDVTFWPNWSAIEHEIGDDLDDDDDDDGPGASVRVPASQPEVVVELSDANGDRHVLLIEAKLGSGKSSHATDGASVTDQLGKYWLHLQGEAKRRKAAPLAVIYLTTSATMPKEELEATQLEFVQKGLERAPLFWLSWRMFTTVVDAKTAPPMLRDCITLLRKRWGLEYVRMEPFTCPPVLSEPWRFRSLRQWSEPEPLPAPWRFESLSQQSKPLSLPETWPSKRGADHD